MAFSFSVLKTTTADVIESKNTERQAVRRQASYVAVSTVETDMVGTFGIGGQWCLPL
jgi:tRNA A37 threonylcarbamoyltransferase TsaD